MKLITLTALALSLGASAFAAGPAVPADGRSSASFVAQDGDTLGFILEEPDWCGDEEDEGDCDL